MEINKTNKQYSTNPPPHTTLDVQDKYDKEFINLIIEIDKLYTKLIKQQKLRIESWIKKLCVPTTNKEWKKNRNLHAISLFDMLLNNKYEEPYNKFAEDSFNFPVLSKILVKSTLSDKFKQFSFNDFIVDKNIDCFSNAYLKQFMQDESILKRNLKNNKMILKEKFGEESRGRSLSKNDSTKLEKSMNKENRSLSKSKSKTRAKSPVSTSSYKSQKSKVINPYDLLKKTYNPYVDQKIINDYLYTRDIEKLKKLIKNLDEEIRYKDAFIFKQNEEKKNLSERISNLEEGIQKIILNKDNDKKIIKIVERVLLKSAK